MSVYRKIINWIDCKWYNLTQYMPIYINLNIFKLYREWYAARKDYKMPVFKRCSSRYAKNVSNAILYINCIPLGWKTKWDYLSFETEPRFEICLFRKYSIAFSLNCPINTHNRKYPANHEYWESMLDYLYLYNKSIQKTFEHWGWQECIYDSNKEIVGYINSWNWDYIKTGKHYKEFYRNWNQQEKRFNVEDNSEKLTECINNFYNFNNKVK